MKKSLWVPFMYLVIGLVILIGIIQIPLFIDNMKQVSSGKRCIEYNKNMWGLETIKAGCKTWA